MLYLTTSRPIADPVGRAPPRSRRPHARRPARAPARDAGGAPGRTPEASRPRGAATPWTCCRAGALVLRARGSAADRGGSCLAPLGEELRTPAPRGRALLDAGAELLDAWFGAGGGEEGGGVRLLPPLPVQRPRNPPDLARGPAGAPTGARCAARPARYDGLFTIELESPDQLPPSSWPRSNALRGPGPPPPVRPRGDRRLPGRRSSPVRPGRGARHLVAGRLHAATPARADASRRRSTAGDVRGAPRGPTSRAPMTLVPGDPLAHRALESLPRAEATVRRRLSADLEREGLSATGFSVLVVLTTAGGELELRALRAPAADEQGQRDGGGRHPRGPRPRRAPAPAERPPGGRRGAYRARRGARRPPVPRARPPGGGAPSPSLDEAEKRTLAELCRKLAA